MALRVESRWLQMRDGARIAIDLAFPTAVPAEASLDSVLIPAREWRSVRRGRAGRLGVPRGPLADLVGAFVEAGLAVVAFDVRGSGASDGAWRMPWSGEELADGREVVDWMLRQSWSNGRVATAGRGYGATTALLIARAHEAVGAAALADVSADLYADLAFPGGVRNEATLHRWSDRLAALDDNRPPGWPGVLAAAGRWLGRGVRPVDEDRGGAELARIVRARHNARLRAMADDVEARDDPFGEARIAIGEVGLGGERGPGGSARIAGPVSGESARSGVPGSAGSARIGLPRSGGSLRIGVWGTWSDGASAAAALRLWSGWPSVREAHLGLG
jgi:predicted acyl esterase